MNCDEYLSMLATVPVEELAYGRAREHSGGCRDCERVTLVVAERERNMVTAYGHLHSSVPAAKIAASALTTSRRRTVALFSRIGLGLATVATLLAWVMSRNVQEAPANSMVAERFRLQCLSPEQAAELLRPYVQSIGRISFRPSSRLGVLTVEASPRQMAAARAVLDRYDNPAKSQCAVELTVPKTPPSQ